MMEVRAHTEHWIGRHRIMCENVESPAIDAWLQNVKVRVLYSDPPWGDGNVRYWATMNKKMTGAEHTPMTYERMLSRIDELVERHVDGRVFIYTGPRWLDMLMARFRGKYHNVGKTRFLYRGGAKLYPCWMVGATTDPSIPAFPLEEVQEVGETANKTVLQNVWESDHLKSDDVMFDPFCGLGYTAKAAVEVGFTFYGNEFNAKRLERTIGVLERHESLLHTERV